MKEGRFPDIVCGANIRGRGSRPYSWEISGNERSRSYYWRCISGGCKFTLSGLLEPLSFGRSASSGPNAEKYTQRQSA